MIKAILMVGDRLVGIQEITEPLSHIRFHVAMMAEPITIMTDDDSSTTAAFSPSSNILNQRIIFQLHRRIGYDQYEYQYAHVEGNRHYSVSIRESIESLRESDENVNLNNLKTRFRSREKMTELLLRYYRS